MIDKVIMYLSRKGKNSKEILFVRDNSSKAYSFPYGKPRNNELGFDDIRKSDGRLNCIVRETFEQTGINPRNPKFAGSIAIDYSETNNPSNMFLNFYRTGDFVPGELKKTEDKTSLWIPEQNIFSLDIGPIFMEAYLLLKKKRRFSGKMKINSEDEIIREKTYFNFW